MFIETAFSKRCLIIRHRLRRKGALEVTSTAPFILSESTGNHLILSQPFGNFKLIAQKTVVFGTPLS